LITCLGTNNWTPLPCPLLLWGRRGRRIGCGGLKVARGAARGRSVYRRKVGHGWDQMTNDECPMTKERRIGGLLGRWMDGGRSGIVGSGWFRAPGSAAGSRFTTCDTAGCQPALRGCGLARPSAGRSRRMTKGTKGTNTVGRSRSNDAGAVLGRAGVGREGAGFQIGDFKFERWV